MLSIICCWVALFILFPIHATLSFDAVVRTNLRQVALQRFHWPLHGDNRVVSFASGHCMLCALISGFGTCFCNRLLLTISLCAQGVAVGANPVPTLPPFTTRTYTCWNHLPDITVRASTSVEFARCPRAITKCTCANCANRIERMRCLIGRYARHLKMVKTARTVRK